MGGVEARKYGSRLTTLIPHDSFYVKIWMETGIVGLVLFLTIYVSTLLRGCYLIMFRIKNNELRGILNGHCLRHFRTNDKRLWKCLFLSIPYRIYNYFIFVSPD